MANRDVNLIIRAKNQASKSLDSVSDALKVLKDAQGGVASSALKTDAAISGLGSELDKLKARSKAFDGLNKAKDIMSTAADAVQRLKTELSDTQSKLDNFGVESQTAAARLTELDRASAELVARHKEQQSAMEAARKETIKSSAAMKELASAERAYKAAQNLNVGVAKRDDTIAAAKSRLDAARSAVEANAAAYAKLKDRVTSTATELRKTNDQVKAAKKVQRDLKTEIDSTSNSLSDQKGNLEKATVEYAAIESSVHEASVALGAFEASGKEAAASTGKLIPEIERLGAVMQALMRYSTGAGQFVDPKTAGKMQALRIEADAAKASWQGLQVEAKKLAAEMRGTVEPTAQQQQQFRAVTAAAGAAKAEYQSLAVQIHQLTGAGKSLAPMFASVATESNRVKQAQRALKGEVDGTAASMGKLKAAAAGGALGAINRESRQAMSVFQRLRGEVLSLATAYVGLYGTISSIGGVLTAHQKMEAAQNRLGVVFEQNQSKIGSELTWLQGQAARLGIEFGTLADQYSKFAVAAQAANFTTDETRRVFLAVAEAGRVNKLSLEDMNGTFLALQQMISKGKVSSEELRQQLGERLPGAMNIMADALNVTTGELYKMLEAGEILADSGTMLKFASELNKRFGPQLAKSLQSTSAQIGKFTNNIFQAQLQVANGGFIEAFNRMLAKLNDWFQSRDGRDFFLSIGAAAGKLTDALSFLIDNVDVFLVALRTLVAVKIASFLLGQINGFKALSAEIAISKVQTDALGVAQVTAGGRMAAFRAVVVSSIGSLTSFGTTLTLIAGRSLSLGALIGQVGAALVSFNLRAGLARAGSVAVAAGLGIMRGAIVAVRVAIAALGGPIGILLTLASIFAAPLIVGWATEVDGATTAADEHLRIMQSVVEEYQNATNETKNWADEIKNVSLDQVEGAIIGLRDANDNLKASLSTNNATPITGVIAAFQEGSQVDVQFKIDKLNKLFKDGQLDTDKYTTALEELYGTLESGNTASRELVRAQLEVARKIKENEGKVGDLSVVAAKLGSDLEGVAEAADASGKTIEDLGGKAEETGKAVGISATKSEEFRAKLDEIRKLMPEIGSGLDTIKDKAKLDEAFAGAAEAAQTIGQLAMAVRDYNSALSAMEAKRVDNLIGNGLAGRIIGVESGGKAAAKNPNSSATGLGQFIESTWLNLFKKYFPDTAAGMSNSAILELRKDAAISRQMVEFYLQENAEYLRKAGVAITDANLYLAHFLGPDGARRLLTAAPTEQVSNILGADQIAANTSILSGKSVADVIAWAQKKVGVSERELAVAEEVAGTLERQREDAAKITEEKRQQNAETQKALEDLGFENEMIQSKIAGMDKEAFIEEQIRGLKEQNKNLTADQEAKARELLARQFDLNKALDAEKDKKTEIEQIEKRIGDLESQRTSLTQQRAIFEEQGNSTKVKEVDAALLAVNNKLTAAIAQAREMYAAMGGSEADAAIAKIDTLGLELEQAAASGKKMAFSAKDIQQNIFGVLDSGIMNMFDSFAKAIANGEDALGALGDAFRQFAADFLMEIAKMIIKQALFNALQSASSGIGGFLSGIGLFHSGGIIGSSTGSGTRSASPAWFSGAMRYHTGGIAGLKPNEVPAILQTGEEVLTQNDPRHARNTGKGQSSGGGTRIVNMFDAASFLSESLKNVIGEEAVLNYVRANPSAFKQAMEG